MTDHYYTQEDNLPDTPETIVSNHNAQLATLNGLVEQTATDVNAVEQNLGWLYQDAEKRGDENAKLAVNNTWQLTQALGVRVTQFDAARLASIAMMKKMADYNKAIAGELEDIQNALDEGDDNHPALRDFTSNLHEEWNEYEGEQMFSDAMEIAYENVFTELHEGIREATGCTDWRTVYNLCDILTGSTEATDRQRELLTALLETVRDTSGEQVS